MKFTALSLIAMAAATGVTGAQVTSAPRGAAQQSVARGRGAQTMVPADRQALERQVRQAIARVVRRQLNLTDVQMQTLQRTDGKYDQQRRTLNRDEHATRLGLKAAMADSAGPDQDKIARYMDALVQAQHRRADLLEAEQKELSTFLTPMQRAQFLALREQLTRRLQAIQRDTRPLAGQRGGAPPPPA